MISKKKIIGLLLAVLALLLISIALPTAEGMSAEGQKVLGIIVFALLLWTMDVFPIGISSVFAMAMIPILGVMEFNETLREFMSTATFFVIVTYAISCALTKTYLARRITRSVIKMSGRSTNSVILALMLVTTFLSAFVSNVPVTAMMMSVALGILNATGAKVGESKLGKTLMIGIPFAAMCGGIATPVGSSVNVIAIQLLEEINGTRISFPEWMLYGLPLVIILVPLSWFMLIRFFKPESIPSDIISNIISSDEIPSKLTKEEIKALIIITLTILFWILGGWFPVLNMTLVATLSMIAFFLPGVNIFSWDEFAQTISWDAVFTVGGVVALGSAVVKTRIGEFIVNLVFENALTWSPLLLFIILALVINFIHLILPVAPAIVTMILPSILIISDSANYSPVAFTIIIAMMATCIMLLPIDTVTVLTYSKRYYSIWDLFKVGLPTSCLWSVIIALYAYLLSNI